MAIRRPNASETQTRRTRPGEATAPRAQNELVSHAIEPLTKAEEPSDANVDSKGMAPEHEEALRHQRIAVAAYYRAEQRGFEPGDELDDWLAAEREIEAAGLGTGS